MKAGWKIKQLGDIAQIKGGKRVPKGYKLLTEPTAHPYITVSDFTEDGTIDLSNLRYISDEVFSGISRYTISSDDLYISIAGTIGKTGIIPPVLDGANLTENACKLIFESGVSKEFIYYFTVTDDFMAQAGTNTRVAAQPKLALERLKTISLPLPPLPEQQRIVAILDEAFEGIAIAKANAEKNLQNARALFESHLQAVFSKRGEGWVETTLGKEIDLLAGFAFKSTQYTESVDGVRLLRGDNIVQGSLRWDDVKRWPSSDTAEYKRYELCVGDVVLAMDRPWVKSGLKRAQISADDLPCLLVQRTARLRTSRRLTNRFLLYLISSSSFTTHILGVQTGIGVPHISGQQIRDFQFFMPTIKEQERLVGNLDDLSNETQRLESIYQQKLSTLDALKKSLLDQAFKGEL